MNHRLKRQNRKISQVKILLRELNIGTLTTMGMEIITMGITQEEGGTMVEEVGEHFRGEGGEVEEGLGLNLEYLAGLSIWRLSIIVNIYIVTSVFLS